MGACPSAPPISATCRYPPLAVPVAARDKPPMSFGGDHPAHGLQSGQAPRGRRLHRLDGQADNEMLRRTGPELQNREQVGTEPPAEAASPAGPASTLPKRPSKGRVPLGGAIGTPLRSRKVMRCPVLPWDRKGARCLMCRLAFPEIAKAHAARHFPERRRNAGHALHQQMLDAVRRRLSNPYLL